MAEPTQAPVQKKKKKQMTAVEKLKQLEVKNEKIKTLMRKIKTAEREKEEKANKKIAFAYLDLINSYYEKKWEGITLETVKRDLAEIKAKVK